QPYLELESDPDWGELSAEPWEPLPATCTCGQWLAGSVYKPVSYCWLLPSFPVKALRDGVTMPLGVMQRGPAGAASMTSCPGAASCLFFCKDKTLGSFHSVLYLPCGASTAFLWETLLI
ncbi:methyl-CpG binding domain protein 6, isoform CRA_a, partial [Mus musculus]